MVLDFVLGCAWLCLQSNARVQRMTYPSRMTHPYPSSGLAFPNITVSCAGAHPDTDIGPVNIVPVDPSNEFTCNDVDIVVFWGFFWGF